eukprot:9473815-Pyramimonas_sp.AAC.1
MAVCMTLVPSSLVSAPHFDIIATLQILRHAFTKALANITATHDFEHVLANLNGQIPPALWA